MTRRRSKISTMNPNEVGKQKFDRFKKKALLVLSTAFRAPLFFMLGCGTTDLGVSIHDHNGEKMAIVNLGIAGPFEKKPYKKSRDGKILDWKKEGDEVDINLRGRNGGKPIHRHPKHNGDYDGYLGTQEFKFE